MSSPLMVSIEFKRGLKFFHVWSEIVLWPVTVPSKKNEQKSHLELLSQKVMIVYHRLNK